MKLPEIIWNVNMQANEQNRRRKELYHHMERELTTVQLVLMKFSIKETDVDTTWRRVSSWSQDVSLVPWWMVWVRTQPGCIIATGFNHCPFVFLRLLYTLSEFCKAAVMCVLLSPGECPNEENAPPTSLTSNP